MNTAAKILQEMREMRAVMRLSSGTALMTVADIAAYLGVADSTVRQKTLTRAAVLALHTRDNPKRRRVERIVRTQQLEST